MEQNNSRKGCSNPWYCECGKPREKDNPYVGLPRPHASTSTLNCLCNHRPPNYSEPELVAIGNWAKYGKLLSEGFLVMENYGIPVYKHARGLGTFGGPIVEGTIGFGLQLANDWNNPNLTTPQKFWNATVMGAESGLTDAVSSPVAAILAIPRAEASAVAGATLCGPVCGLAGGGIGESTGFILYSFVLNEVATGLLWNPLNENYLMYK